MKFIILLFFLILNFFYFSDVAYTRNISLPNEDLLTPLNKFDKYYLRLFKKTARLDNIKDELNYFKVKNKVIVIYFYTNWCPACSMQSKEMEMLQQFYGNKIILHKVNLDENQALAKKFSVISLPTIVIMKNNAIIAKKQKYTKYLDLINDIKKHL